VVRALEVKKRFSAPATDVGNSGRTGAQIKYPMKLSLTKSLNAGLWTQPLGARSIVFLVLMMLIATVGFIPGSRAGTLAAARAQSSSAMQPESYEGMITDTHCGAKHSAAIGMAAADCTRVCVHGGEQFALVDGDSVYVLEGDREALKRVAGQRVRIVGIANGNTISVSSVVAGK